MLPYRSAHGGADIYKMYRIQDDFNGKQSLLENDIHRVSLDLKSADRIPGTVFFSSFLTFTWVSAAVHLADGFFFFTTTAATQQPSAEQYKEHR